MPAESMLSRELRSLQEEVSASRRERRAAAPPKTSGQTEGAAAPAAPEPDADDRQLRTQFGELADEITRFFEQAEANISAHPIESVAGALLIGILIGRLLGRH